MFSRFFIERPIFATVISVVIVIVGIVCLTLLPVEQYPNVVPPTISITASYPGANAKVVADTVANPIEQEVNGVERMLYMSSRCTNDGQLTLDVTFELGTDLNMAQVLVQNRVSIAMPKLPEEVQRQGVTTKKRSPSILLCVNLISPDESRDQLYLSNYATTQIKDSLARIKGVGDVTFLGARDYSMRIWLDPEKLATRNMTAADVVSALKEQNVQVAAGRLGQPPAPAGVDFQLTINTLGRLLEPEQFNDIVVKTGDDGRIIHLHDVARTELGAKNYDVNSYLNGQPAATMALFQLPGANALGTAEEIRAEMARLKQRFPQGVDYEIVYDTTVFVDESVHEVYKTLFEAFILVFIVVLVFLQDWRATILPMIDVPVSLIGTLAVMAFLGFSLNNLTLFGLVLAIGIVVDDAIVVIENVERWIAKGLPPREATAKAMEEITPAVIAITLVLCSVFIPTAFMAGISGQFYRQFALTIAASTVISAINAMTMTPSRAVQIFEAGHNPAVHTGQMASAHAAKEALPGWGIALLIGALVTWLVDPWAQSLMVSADSGPATAWAVSFAVFLGGTIIGWFLRGPLMVGVNAFLRGFNRVFDFLTSVYGRAVSGILRVSVLFVLVYVGLIGLTYLGFTHVPGGFIPEQDKGYLVVNAQLPDGASLERTEEVSRKVIEIAAKTEGVAHTLSIPGYSILTSSNISNVGGAFIILEPFEHRKLNPALSANAILARLRKQFAAIQAAQIVVFGAPPVDGLGTTGGFKMQIQDRGDSGFDALQGAVDSVSEVGNAQPGLVGLFSSFRANQPQLHIDIDRAKAKAENVSLNDVFSTLQAYLGSAYVNDFTRFGRNWQVNVQADAKFRVKEEDIGKLKVRNASGKMVPLATILNIRTVTGPAIVNHYNMYPSAEINGGTAPGTSSGQAIGMMQEIADKNLPEGFGYEWTELTLQQIIADRDLLTKLVFPLGVLFVFLVLAAKYESWSMPITILLIVPMCLLSAIGAIWITNMDNNIFTQIGLLVLVGLAAKNAILIVEFARQLEEDGTPRREAVINACKMRLRPILMTSFAFILGVVPLVLAKGAGAEMRVALGTAVLWGMVGVTIFGLIFTPVFYVVVSWFIDGGKPKLKPSGAPNHPA